jgi:hypothetical protein
MRTPADVLQELILAGEISDDHMSGEVGDRLDLVAELVAYGEAAVPVLIDAIESRTRGVSWALLALVDLGPTARDASDALAARVAHHDDAALALFRVDESRAIALDLHAREGTRSAILLDVARRDRVAASRLITTLLEHDDPDVVRFALGGKPEYCRVIDQLAFLGPALVPLDLIRAHARSDDDTIRRQARHVLEILRSPEDAPGVISAYRGERPVPELIRWIGAMPASDTLIDFERLSTRDWHELMQAFLIVRRRRCAGLATPIDRVRDIALSGLRSPYHGSTIEGATVTAARLVAELGMLDLAPDVVGAIGRLNTVERLVPSLAILRAPASIAIERAIEATNDTSLRGRLEWLGDAVARWVPPREMTVAGGDERFLAGQLAGEHDVAIDSYADALLIDPRDAYSAFQIAWIERGHGTPITGERIDWLRDLGVADELLDELAVPVTPLIALVGNDPDDVVAIDESAIAAGLPSAAWPYLRTRSTADAERCRRETAAHLERVRRACRRR